MLLRLLIVLSVIFSCSNVFATDYYVRPHVTDAACTYGSCNGTSYANAWEGFAAGGDGTPVNWTTVDRGADNIDGNTDDAGSLYVAGTHNELMEIQQSGEVGYPITIESYPSESGIIKGCQDIIGAAGDWTEVSDGLWRKNIGATDPKIVIFNSTINGTEDVSPDSVYEWTWVNPNLDVYTAAGDFNPATYYSKIERGGLNFFAAALLQGVYALDKDYISVKGLTIYGFANMGIRAIYSAVAGCSNWVIENNTIWACGRTNDASANGILVNGSSNTININTIYECGTHGIFIASTSCDSDSNIIKNNVIYNNWHTSIDLQLSNNATVVSVDSNVIQYNNIYYTFNKKLTDGVTNSDSNGIYLDSADAADEITNTYIHYNIINGVPKYAIQIDTDHNNTYIYNNTIYNSSTVDLYFNNDAGTADIKNNIGYSSSAVCNVRLVEAIPATKTFGNNIWFGATDVAQVGAGPATYEITGCAGDCWNDLAYVGTDIESDPLFNSTTYFLPKYSSPAIDAGTDVSLTTDYTGGKVPRGAGVDIGAYEYVPNAIIDTMKSILAGIGINL